MKTTTGNTTRPFEHNADDRNTNLDEALFAITDAIDHIENAMLGAENWADYETMLHHKYNLEQFLSSDHGEAGFGIYVKAGK